MPGWVTLDEFVNEIDEEAVDASELSDAERERLERVFDAAVEFVEIIHSGRFDFGGGPYVPPLPEPGKLMKWGTVMLARRWHTRRRSPDGLTVSSGETGSARIPSFDDDINRALKLGRHQYPSVG